MTERSITGRIGENIACEYLIYKKYKILQRNYRKSFGEIDIIAKSMDGILVFLEVKTLSRDNQSDRTFTPEDNFTTHKRIKVNRICGFFAGEHPDMFNEEFGWRIDLIAVTLFGDGRSEVRHYENV